MPRRYPGIAVCIGLLISWSSHTFVPTGDEQRDAERLDSAHLATRAEAIEHRQRPAPDTAESRMNDTALRAALKHYRSLAANPRFRAIAVPSGVVHPGDRTSILPVLHQWLLAFGDIPAITPPPIDDVYDEPWVAGVRHFQTRHNLQADGVIGRATRAAMMTPLQVRVRQIELALERVRQLGDPGDRKALVLNIPMFRLWGWDAMQWNGRPAVSLRAIVGQPVTPTPRLEADIHRIIFRPYWNVPTSILRGELLPLITADPAYMERHALEIVQHDGRATREVPISRDTVEGLRAGALRLRQRPGPANSLGLIMFQIESDQGVHIHGTPAEHLFEQPQRAFSHGCIRIDDPIALAMWMLGWPAHQVIAATAGADAREVRLAKPVHVSLFYATAAVAPEDGTIRFSEDIYGLDAALERALAARR